MRFLADENFPGIVVESLRRGGHDVLWVRTAMPGESDRALMERAAAEDRTLLDLVGLSQDLEDLLDCRVDVVTEEGWNNFKI